MYGSGRNQIRIGTGLANTEMLRNVWSEYEKRFDSDCAPDLGAGHVCMSTAPPPMMNRDILGRTSPFKVLVRPKVLRFIIRDGVIDMQA